MISRTSKSSIVQNFAKSRSMLAGNTAYDPAATWLIQRTTATGSETSITFSGIPSTYKHLQLRILSRLTGTSASANSLLMRLNSDTTSSYTQHNIYGTGSSVSVTGYATGGTGGDMYFDWATAGGGTTANIFGVAIIDILDYNSTSKNKTVRAFNGVDFNDASGGTNRISLASSLWTNTNAINTISFRTGTAWASGTTFALYGITG